MTHVEWLDPSNREPPQIEALLPPPFANITEISRFTHDHEPKVVQHGVHFAIKPKFDQYFALFKILL